MIFTPPRSRGLSIVAGLAGLALVLGMALVIRAATLHVSFGAYVAYTLGGALLFAAIPLGYWAYAIASLRYELRTSDLVVHWGLVQYAVPLHAIQRLVLGRHLTAPLRSSLWLPGVAVGQATVEKLGPVMVYARYRTAADFVYLVTADSAIGLALTEVQPFIGALQQAQRSAGSAATETTGPPGLMAGLAFWSDRTALALVGSAVLLVWAGVGILFARYQGQPPSLLVHFPPTEAAHLAARGQLLRIPENAIALLVASFVIAALVYNRTRVGAYLLLAAAALAGGVFCIAALGATG